MLFWEEVAAQTTSCAILYIEIISYTVINTTINYKQYITI